MKRKYIFLAAMLVASGMIVGVCGMVVKFAVLEPLGLGSQEPVVALPFVLLRDEGLRYVIEDLHTEEETTMPQETVETTVPEITVPAQAQIPKRDVLERALFIGDSRTCGLRDLARIDGADYFCDEGMSVFNVDSKRLSDRQFQDRTLASLLAEREYSCVLLNLGLNESGYPIDSLIRAYQSLVDTLVKTQPQAVIVLQAVMTVGRDQAARVPYTAPENLRIINDRIRQIAGAYRVHYLDVDPQFADPEGYLIEEMSADGCHLYAAYTRLWSDRLCEEVRKLEF